MYKKFSLIFIIMLIKLMLQAQETFNKLYPLPPLRVTSLNSLVVTDKAYFVTGVVADSISPFRTGALFMRVNLNGEVGLAKALLDSVNQYETWTQSLTLNNNGTFTNNGYNFDSDSNIFFITYNQNGDVMKILNYQIQKGNEDNSFSFVKNSKQDFIFSAVSLSKNFQKKYIICIDQNGNKIWTKEIFINNSNFVYPKIIKNKKGYLISGWGASNFIGKNTINQTVLIQFDTLGNKTWEYYSPDNEDWAGTLGGLTMSDDGDIVYVSGKGKIIFPNANSDYFNWQWCFTKLGYDKKIKWRTFFKSPLDEVTEEGRRLWNMIKLKDNDGFVAGGIYFDPFKEMDDTSNVENGYYGWLVKVNDNGDSLWSRKFNLEQDPYIQYEIRQIKEDKDNNLIIVGERKNTKIDQYSLQGWMMKVDKYGCLVPGCHTVGTSDVDEQKIDLKIYPNPASDFLALYLHNDKNELKDLSFIITDINEKLMKKEMKIEKGVTTVIQLSDYPDGVYFFNIKRKGLLIESKPFIVSH